MAFYRIYRPQTVDELDLKAARDALTGILKSGKFSHAYLFSGSKGTGKTSSARILAKILNCEKNIPALRVSPNTALAEPCGSCDSCQKIQRGASLNVIEIDAASNRRIDDVRAIQERIAVAPAEGMYVVYIVDEVHMMTTEAFNALLKTLEEPPKHVIFVLCTTEAHRLPDTIVSRCTRVLFEKAPTEAVVRSLKKAIAGEKLELAPGVIEAVAERVDGSFRDGMKILEQLAQLGRPITTEDVDALTGFSDEYQVSQFLNAMKSKNITEAMQLLATKEKLGIDFGVFGKRCLEELHRELLAAVHANSKEIPLYKELLNGAIRATSQMKGALLPQLPLELWVVDHCFAPETQSLVSVLQSVPAPRVVQGSRSTPRTEVRQSDVAPPSGRPSEAAKPLAPVLSEAAQAGVAAISNKWHDILRAVSPVNHSLAAFLRSARAVGYDQQRLTIEVFYSFHKQQLEQPKHRASLEQVVGQLFGVSGLQIDFVLGEQPKRSGSSYNASQAPAVPAETTTAPAASDDLVKAAEEAFS